MKDEGHISLQKDLKKAIYLREEVKLYETLKTPLEILFSINLF